jgi:hypothetical protein
MFLSLWRRFVERTLRTSRPLGRRSRGPRLHCEELESRCQPSVFTFSTGIPDGRVATISEPPNAHNAQVEFESADDFVLPTETVIRHASFTGLLTGGATPKDVSNVFITIYRVFPNDSDQTRTPNVPTRVNSPADNEIENRNSAAGELNFRAEVLSKSFTAQNSVLDAATIKLGSRGDGTVTGEEVKFDVTFRNHPLDLPAGHYFFVPKVGLTDQAPSGADFLWLSAPKPIVPPGTPFTPDLQSWMRDDPGLAPDWLRIGTDIIKQGAPPTFTPLNASFELSGEIVKPHANNGHNRAPDLGDFADLRVPAETKVASVALAAHGSTNGAAGQMPAFYDGELFTVNMKEMPKNASASLIGKNPSVNTIYASNDLDEEQDFIPVIDAIQGEGFNPLWRQVLIVFNKGFSPHQFVSDEQIQAAAAGPNPEITLVVTDEVYRCSVVGVGKNA